METSRLLNCWKNKYHRNEFPLIRFDLASFYTDDGGYCTEYSISAAHTIHNLSQLVGLISQVTTIDPDQAKEVLDTNIRELIPSQLTRQQEINKFFSDYQRLKPPSVPVWNEDIPGFDTGNQAANGTNNSADIEFILQPKNGHGADPVEELGGNYIILNSRLEYSEGSGDFPTDNDFRQIGVVVNPTDQGGNTLCSATTRTAYKKMTFQASGFVAPAVDTIIRNASTEVVGTAVGIVVSVDSTNRVVSYLPYPNESGNFVAFANSNAIYSSTNTDHGDLNASSAITAEEVQRHSGDIIYLENRLAVNRASDQIEDIKLIVEM